jgi:ectonucleotide pyrophosphatase/phosphodiesterase family protein 6
MDAFDEFLSEGIMAEWVEPVFPSLSYPGWTTIGTGLYPESHGILGNFMYDQRADAVFDLSHASSTKRPEWWQNAEPIWITASRKGRTTFQHLWVQS